MKANSQTFNDLVTTRDEQGVLWYRDNSVRDLLESRQAAPTLPNPRTSGETFPKALRDLLYEHTTYTEDTHEPMTHWAIATEDLPTLLAVCESLEQQSAANFVTWGWGRRCKTKDTEDFPELEESNSRCVCCETWEHYDEWVESLKKEDTSERSK